VNGAYVIRFSSGRPTRKYVNGVQEAQAAMRRAGPNFLTDQEWLGPIDLVPADDPTGPARWRIAVKQAVRPEGRPVSVQDFIFAVDDLST
jgi:hypothetical protein